MKVATLGGWANQDRAFKASKLSGEGPPMGWTGTAKSFEAAAELAAWHFDDKCGGTWFDFGIEVVDPATGEARRFEASADESKVWNVCPTP